MTTKDKVARRKLSLLELASEMENVSKACRIMGYNRQQFYEIRRNYQTYGAALSGQYPICTGDQPSTSLVRHCAAMRFGVDQPLVVIQCWQGEDPLTLEFVHLIDERLIEITWFGSTQKTRQLRSLGYKQIHRLLRKIENHF